MSILIFFCNKKKFYFESTLFFQSWDSKINGSLILANLVLALVHAVYALIIMVLFVNMASICAVVVSENTLLILDSKSSTKSHLFCWTRC
uniref:Uncharacterized protein n=1 Tax=Panagrolaimus sp. PS1159 TaxID=55785 RepID=A0AC35FFP4_9BILA